MILISGVNSSDIPDHEGLGAKGDHAERNSERPLELHDSRQGSGHRSDPRRGRGLQREPAGRGSLEGDGLPQGSRLQDTLRAAVELLLGDPRVPFGAHRRWRFPPQTPPRSTQGGRLPRDRDPHRQQSGRR